LCVFSGEGVWGNSKVFVVTTLVFGGGAIGDAWDKPWNRLVLGEWARGELSVSSRSRAVAWQLSLMRIQIRNPTTQSCWRN